MGGAGGAGWPAARRSLLGGGLALDRHQAGLDARSRRRERLAQRGAEIGSVTHECVAGPGEGCIGRVVQVALEPPHRRPAEVGNAVGRHDGAIDPHVDRPIRVEDQVLPEAALERDRRAGVGIRHDQIVVTGDADELVAIRVDGKDEQRSHWTG